MKFILLLLFPLIAFSNSWILDHLQTHADFPKPGIQFKCISPLLKNPQAFSKVIDLFAKRYAPEHIDAIVGLESRGFIFGAALAHKMQLPFVMLRKAGKLPGETKSIAYSLEYGKNIFELQTSSLSPNNRVVLVDDLLATGGTANAAAQLVESLGAVVHEIACVIELKALNGRDRVLYPVYTLVSIE